MTENAFSPRYFQEQENQKTSFPPTPTKNGYPEILTRKLIPSFHKRAPKAKDTHPNILYESYKTVPSQPANASDFLLVLLVFIAEITSVHAHRYRGEGDTCGSLGPSNQESNQEKEEVETDELEVGKPPDPIPSIKSTHCAACISRISHFWWFLGSSWV